MRWVDVANRSIQRERQREIGSDVKCKTLAVKKQHNSALQTMQSFNKYRFLNKIETGAALYL